MQIKCRLISTRATDGSSVALVIPFYLAVFVNLADIGIVFSKATETLLNSVDIELLEFARESIVYS